MKTTDAVIGQWSKVFEHYALPPITGRTHYKLECPICSKRNKFRIDDRNGSGSYVCVCGAGDGWELLKITQRKEFGELANEIDILLGNNFEFTPQVKPDKPPLHQRALAKFITLLNLRGSPAELYLRGRGIHTIPGKGARYSDAPIISGFPGIIAIATDDSLTPCYVHKTALSDGKKAAIDAPKQWKKLQDDLYLEFCGSISIKLSDISSTLGIAEGLETALSCKQIYGCNTWSTLSSSLMKRFVSPRGVDHLIIFADNDKNGTGHAAAFHCGNKNLLSNNDVVKVSIRWPDLHGDFNDMLQKGAKVFEWVLEK